MKNKLILVAVLGWVACKVLGSTKSDLRYPLLLITSLPKMVFRYFV